jgi:hypothetical protein
MMGITGISSSAFWAMAEEAKSKAALKMKSLKSIVENFCVYVLINSKMGFYIRKLRCLVKFNYMRYYWLVYSMRRRNLKRRSFSFASSFFEEFYYLTDTKPNVFKFFY